MKEQILYMGLFLISFFGIIGLCELIFYKFRFNAEWTRKLAHISGTLPCLSFPYLFQSHWYVLFIAFIFFIVLFFSYKTGKYKSIHSVNRKTTGSFVLPISVYLLFLNYHWTMNLKLFILPLLIIAISDPLAGLAGNFVKYKNSEIVIHGFNFRKTYIGSTLFFISTLILTIVVLICFGHSGSNILIFGIIYSFLITIVELISRRGFDNISVPLVSVLMLL
jgi:phytol kinase